ncbi:MAG: hypothetical protein IJT64_06105 [Kiritimatiellae bacterium]|nr:hypothetical protein [Kiritimatiellia bacterium]
MFKCRTIIAAAMAVLFAGAAMALDAYYVVAITSMTGEKTYEVMDKERLAAFKKQIALEARFFMKAVSNVQKEWMSPERKDSHQYRWQGQKLKPRAARESQPYTSQEKATEKADKMMDKALGLDDPKKKKRTKLSEKEEEKLYKERMRKQELDELAAEVQKEIDSLIAAAAAATK